MAADQGLEPQFSLPKSDVLPLDESAIQSNYTLISTICQTKSLADFQKEFLITPVYESMNTKSIIIMLVVVVAVFALAEAANRWVPAPMGPINSGEDAPPGSIHNLPVPPAVAAARAYVAQKVGVAEGQVVIMQVTEERWSDSCLGLGGIAESCLQAITPGYRVTAQTAGQDYILRTNADGSQIRQE